VATKSTTPEYTSHSITEFFPRLTPTQQAELTADIQANGQQVPIVVIKNQIIDGRHRYQACRELGIKPKVIDATGDPFLLVQSLNLRRRHLTAEQIAAFHKRIQREHPALDKKLKAIEDAARDRQLGALKQGTKIPGRVPGSPTGKTGRTAALIAAEIGSTATAVKRVAQVEREAPEALPAIEAGKVTAKQVLRHGGTKGAPKRPEPARAPEDRDSLRQAMDQIRTYWKASTAPTDQRLRELASVLDSLVEIRWQAAASLADKKEILELVNRLWSRYQVRLEQDKFEAAAAAEAAKTTTETKKEPAR
jgi:ParB/Sulfiredoxin domain